MKKNKIPVPKFDIYMPNDYMEMKPWDFFKHIDTESKKAIAYLKKSGKQSDLRTLLVNWGKWSRNTNTILRRHIYSTDPLDPNVIEEHKINVLHYKLAYSYWWNRTHYIETYRKGFFGQISDRKNINEGKNNIEKLLKSNLNAEELRETAPDFFNLVDKLSTKRELSKEETEKVLDGDESVRDNKF